MSRIKEVMAVPHLDSQGGFTIKAIVKLESGARGWGAVPKGASALKVKYGRSKTLEEQAIAQFDLERSPNPEAALLNLWVENLRRDVAPKLVGLDAADQIGTDAILADYDTEEYWKRYGINAMLSVSIAVARASAAEIGIEMYEYLARLCGGVSVRQLPVPLTTVLEGGFRVANDLDLQAVMLIPVGALSVDEAHRMTDRVFFKLKDDMGENEPPLNTSVGEQGGFVPRFGSWDARRDDGWEKVTLRSLDIVAEAIEASGFKLGKDLGIGLDCAMNTQRFDPNTQTYTLEKYAKKIQKDAGAVPDPTVTTERLLALYQGIAESHAVYYIEDGFHNADEQGWLKLTKSIGHKARVVGDDLFSDKSGALSPRHLLRRNADAGRANGILVMPNRAGTVSATIDLAQFAKELGYTPAMSVRARETEDDSIVDMAVAAEVPLLRCGGLQCSERNSKFDRLKRIEALVNPTARYASASVLPPMQGA